MESCGEIVAKHNRLDSQSVTYFVRRDGENHDADQDKNHSDCPVNPSISFLVSRWLSRIVPHLRRLTVTKEPYPRSISAKKIIQTEIGTVLSGIEEFSKKSVEVLNSPGPQIFAMFVSNRFL